MPTLMIQGTTSDAGKSTLVTALCRLLHRRGLRVAPFKPQNMALNSAVTIDGGEVGRAQAVQARAAGIDPHTDHNPVLLKPVTDRDAQVIVHGRPRGVLGAVEYHEYKRIVRPAVLESWQRLAGAHDWVIVEGAGSPAEVNLRAHDIANMGFAEEADCPVWLVGDIDRGGIFAHFVGTLQCLSESERRRVRGFIVNRFRGDSALLQPGLEWLERETAKPVLAVVPYLHGLHIAAEDALPRERASGGGFRIAVPALPRISNHTDFDPVRRLPGVEVRFVGPGERFPPADLVVLPGTKNTRADLAWLHDQGWVPALARHLRYGGRMIGLCGGMQMLGRSIHDPLGVEGPAGVSEGLGWLELDTTLAGQKTLARVEGRLSIGGVAGAVDAGEAARALDAAAAAGTVHAARAAGAAMVSAAVAGPALAGYEIHHGTSSGPALRRPAAYLGADRRPDGAISEDGQVLGTYVHGIFDRPEACSALLRWAGFAGAAGDDSDAVLEQAIDRIADALDFALDWRKARSAGLVLTGARS